MLEKFSAVPIDEALKEAVMKLEVQPTQTRFIEPIADCLQEAEEESCYRPVACYLRITLVGFAMYGFFPSEGCEGRVWLDRYMLDAAYQGKGIGRSLLLFLLWHLQMTYDCKEIYLSVFADNIHAIALYEHVGFYNNGELDTRGEHVMVKNMRDFTETYQ